MHVCRRDDIPPSADDMPPAADDMPPVADDIRAGRRDLSQKNVFFGSRGGTNGDLFVIE